MASIRIFSRRNSKNGRRIIIKIGAVYTLFWSLPKVFREITKRPTSTTKFLTAGIELLTALTFRLTALTKPRTAGSEFFTAGIELLTALTYLLTALTKLLTATSELLTASIELLTATSKLADYQVNTI